MGLHTWVLEIYGFFDRTLRKNMIQLGLMSSKWSGWPFGLRGTQF